MRRAVDLVDNLAGRTVYLRYSNDDDVVIYINGTEVVNSKLCHKGDMIELPAAVTATLRPGRNVISAYCLDRGGSALLDFGLLVQCPGTEYFPRTAVQKSVDVQATQTHYTFTCGPVDLKITFMAPLLMENLELVSRLLIISPMK